MGEDEWAENPRLALAQEWHDLVRLWFACRGEAGIAHWPDAGGVGDQAAWIVDAFAALASADADWRHNNRPGGGG